jgi:hypothetical protein
VSILDRLPIGVMSVRNGAIAFMNYTLRSLFDGAYASLGLFVFVPLSYMDPKDPQLRELRELHTDFQEIFHNCFDGIYVADGTGRSLWLNEGFERAKPKA